LNNKQVRITHKRNIFEKLGFKNQIEKRYIRYKIKKRKRPENRETEINISF